MTLRKYAFITQTEQNVWEAFHIERVDSDATPIIAQLWDDAISSGEVISGVNATDLPNVAHNSSWDGTAFTLPDPFPNHWKLPNGIPFQNPNGAPISSFVLCRNNKVFFITSMNKSSYFSDKWTAAFSNPVSAVEIQDGQIVTLGQIWDGSNWITSGE